METFVLHIVQKVVNSPEFISRISDAVIHNPVFITPVAALGKCENQKLSTEQAKREDTFQQFVTTGTKMDPRSVSVASEGSYRPPTDISNEKTNLRANSIQQISLGHGNEWKVARPFQAVPVHTGNKPYRTKSASPYKPDDPPDVHEAVAIKPVSGLLADTVGYRKYRIIKNSTRCEEDVANELYNMKRGAAV